GIADELGRPKTALSGDVTNLMRDGLVEKLPDRTSRIAYNRIRNIFNKILPDNSQGPRIGVPVKGMPSLFPTLQPTPQEVIAEVFPGLNLPKKKSPSKKRPPEKVEWI